MNFKAMEHVTTNLCSHGGHNYHIFERQVNPKNQKTLHFILITLSQKIAQNIQYLGG
jgi:hypothetical protein